MLTVVLPLIVSYSSSATIFSASEGLSADFERALESGLLSAPDEAGCSGTVFFGEVCCFEGANAIHRPADGGGGGAIPGFIGGIILGGGTIGLKMKQTVFEIIP